MNDQSPSLYDQFQSFITAFVGNLLWAALLFIIGLIIIKLLLRGLRKLLRRKNWDPTMESFLASATMFLLYTSLGVGVIILLGVPASAFIAILGSAGLAIGLALQGSLSNIAGGVLLLVLRPLRVGDFIEAEGSLGTVESINLFYTQVGTPDGQVLHLPNGKLANNKILNFSQKDTRRITIEVGIGYEDDVAKAREVLLELASQDTRILQDPAPNVVVNNLGDNAVELKLWVWVNRTDFGSTLAQLREATKSTLIEKGLSIPYPQRTVHMISDQGK